MSQSACVSEVVEVGVEGVHQFWALTTTACPSEKERVMEITEQEKGGVKVLGLAGRMMGGPDEAALSDLINELAESGQSKVVLDLSDVEWMNSRGLGICIGGLTRLRSRGGDLRLAAVPKTVASILEKCNVQTIFRIFPTVDEAVSSF